MILCATATLEAVKDQPCMIDVTTPVFRTAVTSSVEQTTVSSYLTLIRVCPTSRSYSSSLAWPLPTSYRALKCWLTDQTAKTRFRMSFNAYMLAYP